MSLDEGTNAAFLTQQHLAQMTPQGVIDDIRWKFDDAIREDRKPALVVLDTMGRWLSGKYLDYNGYGDMSAATLAILTLAADLGQHDTATLVSHHSNKSHRGRGGRRFRLPGPGRHIRQCYQPAHQKEVVRAKGDNHPRPQRHQ